MSEQFHQPMPGEQPLFEIEDGRAVLPEEIQARDENREAAELGLPVMDPADRAYLEGVANAQTAADLPEGVSDEHRRAASYGFYNTRAEANGNLERMRTTAREALESHDTHRAGVEQTLMEGERQQAGGAVFAEAAHGGYDSVEARVEAEMAGKHAKVKGGAREMLATNLTNQYYEQGREAADRAADAREAHINARGGIARLNTIDREDREAADRARKEAAEAEQRKAEYDAAESEAHDEKAVRDEAARIEAEEAARLKEWQERMGVGSPEDHQERPDVVVTDRRHDPSERPDYVPFKDWFNMSPTERRQAVEQGPPAPASEGDDWMAIADLVRENDAPEPATRRVPESAGDDSGEAPARRPVAPFGEARADDEPEGRPEPARRPLPPWASAPDEEPPYPSPFGEDPRRERRLPNWGDAPEPVRRPAQREGALSEGDPLPLSPLEDTTGVGIPEQQPYRAPVVEQREPTFADRWGGTTDAAGRVPGWAPQWFKDWRSNVAEKKRRNEEERLEGEAHVQRMDDLDREEAALDDERRRPLDVDEREITVRGLGRVDPHARRPRDRDELDRMLADLDE